jgi:AbrB family looped-hinge helix DNA binding protein
MARYEVRRERTAGVRETTAAYGVPPDRSGGPQALGFKVTVADRGRMVLPAEVRERLKIGAGDWLTLILEPDGVIRMLTGEVYARNLRGVFKHLAPGRSLVDELITERRREAAKEEKEFRSAEARVRKKKRR